MQLELPPFSQFIPSLLMLLTVLWVAAWGWSVLLLITRANGVRGLSIWLWVALLVFAPMVSALVFLIGGAPISARARRAAVVAAATAVVVTVAVVALQQISIMDCRVVRRSQVCEMEPRSDVLPVAVGMSAAIGAGAFMMRRRPSTPTPQPLATAST